MASLSDETAEAVSQNGSEEDPVEDTNIFDSDGAMHPDHPLLRRAQEALKAQLLKSKAELEEVVREKTKALKDAQCKREALGVELYGFQQQLANLQLSLERSYDEFSATNNDRLQKEEELSRLKSLLEDDSTKTKAQRAKADQLQGEMDDLSTTLKQVELYNEAMKSEIAVTRRATYAAEESMQKLEKEKQHQDFLIDQLQETLRRKNRTLQMYAAQLEAQKRETRGAQETLAEAEREMENIFFEKQQLVAQWKSCLLAIQRRDKALQEIDSTFVAQQEQAHSMETETSAYRKEIIKEQVKNEQLTAIMQKSEGDMKHVAQKIADLKSKQEHLHETYGKLQRSLEQTEERMQRSKMQARAIHNEAESVRKLYVKVASDTHDLKDKMMTAVGDQATAERSSSKTAKETVKLRQLVSKEQMLGIDLQNELAKLQVDILNTQSHNERLEATLNLLDEELKEKEKVAEKFEGDIQRRNDEVEKKTRELDRMNRQYEKLTADMEDESTGPLEATISNLEREIQQKGVEAQELQRRWVSFQMELVTLQNENNKLSESMATLNCKNAIVFQKKRRLEQQLGNHIRDIKTLENGMGHLHTDIQRLNGLIAKNSDLQAVLENDNFNLENEIMIELKATEEEAIRLECQIDQAKEDKRQVLSDIIEAEREIMLWERRIQLEREMHDVLDPEAGQDVVSAMKKEIHRMELRHADLMKIQERLIQDMERSVAKREMIATKGKAVAARKGPDMTEQQLKNACNDLRRSIRDTDKESVATDQRIHELDEGRATLAANMESSSIQIRELKDEEQVLRQELDEIVFEKTKTLLETAHSQKIAKGYEDVRSGKYRSCVQKPELLPEETDKALDRLRVLKEVVENLIQSHPEFESTLNKVLLHAIPISL